jgi:hypothetical protein
MRVLLLILAIVLLPLRGWVGDAMMLAPVQQATQAAAGHAMHATHAMHTSDVDAHGIDHSGMHGDTESPHPHATCDTCQFCHSVAMTAWPEVPMPAEAPRHAPVAQAVVFASAEAAQGFKPPIS